MTVVVTRPYTPPGLDLRGSGAVTSSEKLRESFFFRLVIVSSVAFLLTVLLMVASSFSTTASPSAQTLNRNAVWVLGVEVAVILIAGTLAMLFDNRKGKDGSGSDDVAP